MISRPIKTARSLQILHEFAQIPPYLHSGKELPPRFIVRECLIGLTLTCDVSRENWSNLKGMKSGQRTQVQGKWKHSNWIRKQAKSTKCDNNKQKRTHSFLLRAVMIAQWARGELSKVLYEEGPPTFPPPTPLSFYIPFLTEKVPLSYTFYWQMTPPCNCRKCSTIFCSSWINP